MEKSLEKRIGKAARKARVSLGMTQEDAAEQINVSVEFYSRIERGTALPSLKTFLRMAVTFGVSTDKLLGLTENEAAQRLIMEFSTPPPDDPPELKRLVRKLRKTSVHRVRFVNTILNEMEKVSQKENDASPDDLDDLQHGLDMDEDEDRDASVQDLTTDQDDLE